MQGMGFDAEEVDDNIRQLKLCGDDDIWGDRQTSGKAESKEPELRLEVEKAPDLTSLDDEERKGISIESEDGKTFVTVKGMLTREAEEKIIAVTRKDKREEAAIKARQHRRKVRETMPPAPADKGEIFAVPMLQFELDGAYGLAEPDLLLPETWSPLAMLAPGQPVFGKDEFSFDVKTRSFQFFLEGERMRYRPLDGQQQGFLLNLPDNYTEFPLIRWLAVFCRQDDVSHNDMLEFCNRAVHSLLDAGHPLPLLEQGRKVVARLILEKIRDSRSKAKKDAFQNTLLRGLMPAKVDFELEFTFPRKNYADGVSRYSGAYQFGKHYVDIPRVGTWLRNVDRQPESFFLPTSSDRFYPDFVAKLQDGRVLVMEYKGRHLLETPDTLEKRNIGELWANKSQGKGCFALVCESVDKYKFDKQMKQISI